MDTDTLNLTFMVISIVTYLYQTDAAKRMPVSFLHIFSRSLIEVCQQTELSKKCNILLFSFVLTEVLFLFDFVNLHMIRQSI